MSLLSSIVAKLEAIPSIIAKWAVSAEEIVVADAEAAWTTILAPFLSVTGKTMASDLEAVLAAIAAEGKTAVIDYLTGVPDTQLFTDIIGKAAAMGMQDLAALTPTAMQVLVKLKQLAVQGVTDVATAVDTALGMPAPIPQTSTAPSPTA